jgi:hypothetical protein
MVAVTDTDFKKLSDTTVVIQRLLFGGENFNFSFKKFVEIC